MTLQRKMPRLYLLLLIAAAVVGERSGNQRPAEVGGVRRPLWCTMNTGERCDPALETALLQVQAQLADKNYGITGADGSTGTSGSVASNFRLLVPVMSSPSPATHEDRDLDRLEQELEQYINSLGQNDRAQDWHEEHSGIPAGSHVYDTQLKDAGNRWIKINWQGVGDKHNHKDVSNDQHKLHDQNKRWLNLHLFDPQWQQGVKLNELIKPDQWPEQNNRIKINLYGVHYRPNKDDRNNLFESGWQDRNKESIKLNDDALFVNGHNEMKLFDNRAVDDKKLHDDKFMIVKGGTPRYTLSDAAKGQGVDSPFSDIPSSEFTKDVPSRPSVKKDLGVGSKWLDSMCQSMEDNREDREEQKCGLCCSLHAQLMRRGVTAPRTEPAAVDLTRPATERGSEDALEALLEVLGRVLEARRSLHVMNSNQTDPLEGSVVV